MLRLRLARRRQIAREICEFTFESADPGILPDYDPGAHLTVQTPSGDWRSYSLTGDRHEPGQYVIAVKYEEKGRGGSRSLHEELEPGQVVNAHPPKNAFPLHDAPRSLFVAGGIGITPMFPMLRHLIGQGKDAQLIYLSRSPEDAAYVDELQAPDLAPHVLIHHDQGQPDKVFDFWPYVSAPDDRHIYFCGPPSLMAALHLLTVHWPRSKIHTESFEGVEATGGESAPFRVRRARTGEVFDIPVDQTILDVLRANGIAVESSCESGTCGSCKMPLVSGEAIHRDIFLSDEEKAKSIMPCVSRAAVDEITLDF